MTEAKQSQNQAIQIKEDGSSTILFDLRIYSTTAIKAAAYKFARECSIHLNLKNENQLIATIIFPALLEANEQRNIAGAFCNEVIDQDLREHLANKTEGVRNLILAHAFSNTALIGSDDDGN